MKDNQTGSMAPGRQFKVGTFLGEAALVAVAGVALAFAANEISPRGLALARSYFPAGTANPARPGVDTGSTRSIASTNSAVPAPARLLAAQIAESGLQLLDGSQAEKLFHDVRFKQGIIVFIDARDEQHYQEGHIPGACEFDPYHPEKYFKAVLHLCQSAEQIVVYCNGGDCDDSLSAALLLRDVGIAKRKLFVYEGGIVEWTAKGLPVEPGARNSGNLRGGSK